VFVALTGPVANGQTVTVFDPCEHDMAYEGVVHELDDLGRFTVEVDYGVEEPVVGAGVPLRLG